MSVFVQQQSTECDFASSDSWVILTPIEQSIKRKIEAVGTPLKDWDIQINYGIKTGYNDAFIINTEKRNEILENCRDEAERTRTAELIRPILRGRDIKRYGYEWANLWLIATFPSRHYDIELYPAVRQYLLSFGMERLEQTGKKYKIQAKTSYHAKIAFHRWCKLAEETQVPELKSMARTIRDKLDRIVSYWTFRHISNAKMEGFNNKIRWLIRQAYGFRDREYFKLKIYQLPEISCVKDA